jgi:hypothetical protein
VGKGRHQLAASVLQEGKKHPLVETLKHAVLPSQSLSLQYLYLKVLTDPQLHPNAVDAGREEDY